jgi:hypothetical protein
MFEPINLIAQRVAPAAERPGRLTKARILGQESESLQASPALFVGYDG